MRRVKMLIVVGHNDYSMKATVLDTDDGVVEEVSYKKLKKYAFQMKLDIRGYVIYQHFKSTVDAYDLNRSDVNIYISNTTRAEFNDTMNSIMQEYKNKAKLFILHEFYNNVYSSCDKSKLIQTIYFLGCNGYLVLYSDLAIVCFNGWCLYISIKALENFGKSKYVKKNMMLKGYNIAQNAVLVEDCDTLDTKKDVSYVVNENVRIDTLKINEGVSISLQQRGRILATVLIFNSDDTKLFKSFIDNNCLFKVLRCRVSILKELADKRVLKTLSSIELLNNATIDDYAVTEIIGNVLAFAISSLPSVYNILDYDKNLITAFKLLQMLSHYVTKPVYDKYHLGHVVLTDIKPYMKGVDKEIVFTASDCSVIVNPNCYDEFRENIKDYLVNKVIKVYKPVQDFCHAHGLHFFGSCDISQGYFRLDIGNVLSEYYSKLAHVEMMESRLNLQPQDLDLVYKCLILLKEHFEYFDNVFVYDFKCTGGIILVKVKATTQELFSKRIRGITWLGVG
jgi:uncharacterized protein YuzE